MSQLIEIKKKQIEQTQNEIKHVEEVGTKFISRIEYDEFAENPRDYGCDESKIVCFHKRYDLPNDIDLDDDRFDSWQEIEEEIFHEYEPRIIHSVYMYDHSGQDVALDGYGRGWYHSSWDAGKIGFIFIGDKDDPRTDEELEAQLQREFEAWRCYVNGSVYWVGIYEIPVDTPDDENAWEAGELIDSCGSFYGYEDAKQSANQMIKDLTSKERIE